MMNIIVIILITNLVMVDIKISSYHLHSHHKKRCYHNGDPLCDDTGPLHGDLDPHHGDRHHG